MTVDALLFRHEVARYLVTRAVHRFARPLWTARLAPLDHVRLPRRQPPGAGWLRLRVRLSGICGSDLNLITGRDSLYLEPEATYPFVPGHEIVGDVDPEDAALAEAAGVEPGTRVAVWAVLGCRARGVEPPCAPCRAGWEGRCERREAGWPGAGLAIGFNRETGGGWSDACLAHRSQLWPLPQAVGDRDAVLLDPAATALAALLRTEAPPPERTLVIGGGTIGLLVGYLHAALRRPGTCELLVRHGFQRDWALAHGVPATVVRGAAQFRDWAAGQGMPAKRVTGYGFVFHGVYDRVIDAAGSRASVTWALNTVKPGGQVVLVTAPPSLGGVDPTPIWYRDVVCRGIYVYGRVPWEGEWAHPYEILLPGLVAGSLAFRDLVTHAFPLSAHARALTTAAQRRGTGAIKVVFHPDARAP